MFKVRCPRCNVVREVKAKKKWMTGEQPFENLCKKCCQEGKEKSEEHRRKLSDAVKALQTEEVLTAKSKFMKSHPEVWQGNIRGKGDTFTHSDETRAKIGKSVHITKRKGSQ